MSGGQILMKVCPGGCGGRIPTTWSDKQCVKCHVIRAGIPAKKLEPRNR